MKISYNWIRQYLPADAIKEGLADCPKKLGSILTSVGLELESLYKYDEIPNGLQGLIVGEVIFSEKHPDADKLKVTRVNTGNKETLPIVCGADNIAVGQKVVVAPVGITIYPRNGDSLVIKKAKIRGIESEGMICAEDEIGVGDSHAGIIVLPESTLPGTLVSEYYKPYDDWILEIGLTPNRIDAMSHLGAAKDICAYLSHHEKRDVKVISPFEEVFETDNVSLPIGVEIENKEACPRYSGISISGISVAPSPAWLQNRLKSIGIRPVNNVVDVTNFILHETGQPLHVFDADRISNGKIIVKNLPADTSFVTLDNKERKLSNEDLMICDGQQKPMCFGGVFGGIDSGVTNNTYNIFLESAWFNPSSIRKTSFRHNLRTEAAIRFEKGVDISNTVRVLKRAAMLIKEIAGGQFSSDIIDVYATPKKGAQITVGNHYLERLSGKHYQPEAVKNILKSLNFSIINESANEITVEVPLSNPDITLPADIVEEIMRIDGLDNIEIPATIKMTPAIETGSFDITMRDKISGWLTGNRFSEIFTNSITNTDYYNNTTLSSTVKIINSLSEELTVMRPTMIPTGLESVSYNLNRKNNNLFFFEFGKTYSTAEAGKYNELENLTLFFTGNYRLNTWKEKEAKADVYYVKGVCNSLLILAGLKGFSFCYSGIEDASDSFTVMCKDVPIAEGGNISLRLLDKFSIKQPVFYLTILWKNLIRLLQKEKLSFSEIAKFPYVTRDLSIIVDKKISYQSVEESVNSLQLPKLTQFKLFDMFESEKLGVGKKSFAITFTFLDKERTLTDTEIDSIMKRIMKILEKENNAEIRNA